MIRAGGRTQPTGSPVQCWGCECGVPLRGETHEEPTETPGQVYVYPCTRRLEHAAEEEPGR